jgi:large subunit ribosomal protein L22
MKALLKDCHQSPRKVRLIADMIRGKSVPQARATLSFMPNKASDPIEKLMNSAAANALSKNGVSAEDLFVKAIAVNKGVIMRRVMPKSRGRAVRYKRTLSIVTIELAARPGVHVHDHADHAGHAHEEVKTIEAAKPAKTVPATKKPTVAAKKPRATAKKSN